jgi:tetratricopeptide (TPR) repeat protein/serine/threonine protein kinase
VPLPLPVAALLRRAQNAKSPKERHDTAYFAWEASIRLAVAARPPEDPAALNVAPLGRWAAALAPPEAPRREPPILAAHALFTEVGEGARASAGAVAPRRLLDALVAYRNAVIGHGAARAAEFYDASAGVLAAGLEAAWTAALFWPAGARLAYVESIEIDSAGARRARILDLSGPVSSLEDPRGTPGIPAELVPRRLYLRAGAAWQPLHPLLIYQEAHLRERVLFFNGRGRASHFLDYVSGEALRGKALAEAFPTIEDEVAALLAGGAPRAEAEPAPARDDPALFDDYRILGKIGEGGMGVVYLARQESLAGRLVALKVLPTRPDENPVAAARFRREIAALARCDHPNVVKILASGAARETLYYAMELVDGADLARLAEALADERDFDAAVSRAVEHARERVRVGGESGPEGPHRMRDARGDLFAAVPDLSRMRAAPGAAGARPDRFQRLAALFRDAARGLHHLHEQGIVHRDVKPANLMITASDHRLVLMDLGLASVRDASLSLTRDRDALLGTLRYMAPEQLQKSVLQVDRRADVYALGATLYELATQRPFFDGDTEARLTQQVLWERPLEPRRANPEIPRDLAVIIEKAVEKDPRLRYDGADALAADLDAFARGAPIAARPPTLGYVLRLAVRRNRAAAAALLAAALLLLAGVPLFFVSRDRAARATRDAFFEAARRDAGAKRRAFEAAGARPRSAPGAPEGRASLGRRLALGLDAAYATRSLAGLLPADAEARREAFEAALELGAVATEAEEWDLAGATLEEAARLGVDEASARARLADLERARRRVEEEHRRAVEAVLAHARGGRLAERPGAFEDALFTLVRYPEAQTVALLAAALDGVTDALRAALRATLLEAATPTADEARTGVPEIAGLGAAVEARLALAPGGALPSATADVLAAAAQRLEARAAREVATVEARAEAPGLRRILARAERERAGEPALLLAKLCAEALGRIGIADGAVAALGRYVFAEEDEVRAAPAALALCLLGGAEAERLVVAARDRFGTNGSFWARVAPFHARTGVSPALESADAKGYFRLGLARAGKGDDDGAIEAYTRAIELDPRFVYPLVNRGTRWMDRRDLEHAIADFTRALELDPTETMAWFDRGLARERKGDLDGAIADFTRAIELDPRYAAAWAKRGDARARKGELVPAIADLDRAVLLAPEQARPYDVRARVRADQRDFAGAIADYTRALELEPEGAPLLAGRADAKARGGDFDGAIADASRAIELDPRLAVAWSRRGDARAYKGELEAAIADYTRAIEIEPEFVPAFAGRARARREARDLDGAIADASRAIELEPARVAPWSTRAAARRAKGDRAGAIGDYSRAIELEPGNVTAWNRRGIAEMESRDLDAALADFTRAIELDPRCEAAFVNRANVREERDDLDGALADYTHALELDPLDALAWTQRGGTRLVRGDAEGALADSTRAIELDPRADTAWVNRAMARAAKGDLDGAIADCGRALELEPRMREAWYHRGFARAERGDREGARADLARFLELAPDGPDAAAVREKLAELGATPRPGP